MSSENEKKTINEIPRIVAQAGTDLRVVASAEGTTYSESRTQELDYVEENISVNLESNVNGTLPESSGGTGHTTYANGEILIGKTDGTLAVNTLTAGAGITINNSDGTVEIVNNSSDPTLQTTYDNSPDGDIALAAGKDFMLSSTVAGFRPPAMTSTQFQLIPLPLNGLQSWSNTEDRPIYNRGTAVSPDYVVGAYLSDVVSALDNLAYGSMGFQNNATETIIPAPNTWVEVAGTYVSGDLLGFSRAGSTLTYNDTETRVISLSTVLSFAVPDTATLEFAYYFNSSLLANSVVKAFSGSTSESALPVFLVNQNIFNTSSNLRIFVRNLTNSDNVTVINNSVNLASIGGATSGTNNLTRQDTYNNGVNADITLQTGRQLNFITTSNSATLAQYFNNDYVPAASDNLYEQVTQVQGVTKALYQVQADPASPLLNNNSFFFGQSAGALRSYFQYYGVDDTARISAKKLTVGLSNSGVMYNLATIIDPTFTYPQGFATTVWNSLEGTNLVLENSFSVGDTIEIDVCGAVQLSNNNPTAIAPSFFTIQFGSVITVQSNNLNPTSVPNSFNGSFNFKYKITRMLSNNLLIGGSGIYENVDGSVKLIKFSSGLSVGVYNPAVTEAINISYTDGLGTGNPSDKYNFVCFNLNIKQYS